MTYLSTGLSIVLCGLRFRLRVVLDDEPEPATLTPAGVRVCERTKVG